MTDLQELLHRAAGADSPRFTVDDVRHRVRRRRKVRRGVLVGLLTAVVLATVAVVESTTAPDVDLVEAPGVPDLGRRWTAIYSNEMGVAPEGSFIELRGDGTFLGSDGCNSFMGRYTIRDDRLLVVDLTTTKKVCASQEATGLVEILRADPTVGAEGGALGTLRLSALDRGYVVFEASDPGPDEGMIASDIVLPVPGGDVTVRFLTPRTISVGDDRQVRRSYVENNSTGRASVWASHAIEGLPATCPLGEHHRWEDLEPELSGPERGELFPQLNPDPGESLGTAFLRDVPETCRGDFTLVLLATSDPVDGEVVERRVPFTIR